MLHIKVILKNKQIKGKLLNKDSMEYHKIPYSMSKVSKIISLVNWFPRFQENF